MVKLHPRAPQEEYNEVSAYVEQNKNIRLVSTHPHELLLASDIVFTPFSTVGIEAVLMGKPCISLQPGQISEDYFIAMTKSGIVPVGYTEDDCRALVKKALSDENYRKAVAEKASSFKTDGKATDRVTQLVYDMVA